MLPVLVAVVIRTALLRKSIAPFYNYATVYNHLKSFTTSSAFHWVSRKLVPKPTQELTTYWYTAFVAKKIAKRYSGNISTVGLLLLLSVRVVSDSLPKRLVLGRSNESNLLCENLLTCMSQWERVCGRTRTVFSLTEKKNCGTLCAHGKPRNCMLSSIQSWF